MHARLHRCRVGEGEEAGAGGGGAGLSWLRLTCSFRRERAFKIYCRPSVRDKSSKVAFFFKSLKMQDKTENRQSGYMKRTTFNWYSYVYRYQISIVELYQ